MVDALDEAEHNLKIDLLECIVDDRGIIDQLPPWCALLVTSRPEESVRAALQPLDPTELDAEENMEQCEADVRVFLHAMLAPFGDEMSAEDGRLERAVDTVLKKSECNFLYLNFLRQTLDKKKAKGEALGDVSELPDGLAGEYKKQMKKILVAVLAGALAVEGRDGVLLWRAFSHPGYITNTSGDQPLIQVR